jgi:nucleotide-binding universal stress UspA family protein
MTVIAWIVEATWPACVDAARRYTPADVDLVLLHVSEPEPADVARGAFAGLLGRGHAEWDPGARVEALESAAAARLLDRAAARLGRSCIKSERTGRCETEVIAAAEDAELLVIARDGDRTHVGPRSLGPATRYVVDHAPCPVLLVWPNGATGNQA